MYLLFALIIVLAIFASWAYAGKVARECELADLEIEANALAVENDALKNALAVTLYSTKFSLDRVEAPQTALLARIDEYSKRSPTFAEIMRFATELTDETKNNEYRKRWLE